ncbi:DUF4377 domain-containing protein [Polaribacter sp.]|uniref:DUF4377 domain-containing protein n=1 Tax=Polaribacter sp. TaxID=1920175 RepID=UPI003F6C103A
MKKYLLFLCVTLCLTSCEDKNSNQAEKTLIVASQKADCVGVAPQKCFLVKENDAQNWTYFYDSIINFEYEEGFEYELVVRESEIKNPPQDASSIKTTLVQIISKIEKTSENLPI